MCSHNNIHLSFFQITDGLLLLCCRAETAQQIHPDREILHSLGKRIINLLGKNGCRRKVCHLFILLHCFESCTDRNLRLSVTDIPADQPVHNLMTLHIPLGCINGKHLIFGLFKREQFFKLSLPYRIRSIHIAILFFPLGI